MLDVGQVDVLLRVLGILRVRHPATSAWGDEGDEGGEGDEGASEDTAGAPKHARGRAVGETSRPR